MVRIDNKWFQSYQLLDLDNIQNSTNTYRREFSLENTYQVIIVQSYVKILSLNENEISSKSFIIALITGGHLYSTIKNLSKTKKSCPNYKHFGLKYIHFLFKIQAAINWYC